MRKFLHALLNPLVPRDPLNCLQRGLFERHKVLFALMLTNKILVSSGKVKASDVDVLLKGGGALDIASVSEPPDPICLAMMPCSCIHHAASKHSTVGIGWQSSSGAGRPHLMLALKKGIGHIKC